MRLFMIISYAYHLIHTFPNFAKMRQNESSIHIVIFLSQSDEVAHKSQDVLSISHIARKFKKHIFFLFVDDESFGSLINTSLNHKLRIYGFHRIKLVPSRSPRFETIDCSPTSFIKNVLENCGG